MSSDCITFSIRVVVRFWLVSSKSRTCFVTMVAHFLTTSVIELVIDKVKIDWSVLAISLA